MLVDSVARCGRISVGGKGLLIGQAKVVELAALIIEHRGRGISLGSNMSADRACCCPYECLAPRFRENGSLTHIARHHLPFPVNWSRPIPSSRASACSRTSCPLATPFVVISLSAISLMISVCEHHNELSTTHWVSDFFFCPLEVCMIHKS